MHFMLYRQEKIKVTQAFYVKIKLVDDVFRKIDDILAEFKAGVTTWAKTTKEGQRCYRFADIDMTLTDIPYDEIENILEFCPNIISLTYDNVGVPENWTLDTPVCNEIEEPDTSLLQGG